MNKITQALQSRTFWTLVVMFLIGGVQAITAVIPAGWETPIMGVLGILAAYFHVNPSQNYDSTQS